MIILKALVPYVCIPGALMLIIMFIFRKRFLNFQRNLDKMWRDDDHNTPKNS